jgi:6-phosphofructokinase 1
MSAHIQRIGILTGGGDAPGLNAVIRAVTFTARHRYGWDVVGLREGFDGLLQQLVPITLNDENTRDILARGGTILGAVNRGNPFVQVIEKPDGTVEQVDLTDAAIARLHALEIDALIVAGGDGTMAIAHKLIQRGIRIIGVPKTIDNDLSGTDVTFGFDTAIVTATEALDKLQTTAESHLRVMVLEVMGRNAGWIALLAGVAGGADAILIPEIPYDIDVVCAKIESLRKAGRRYSLVVVAEGAAPQGGSQEYYIDADRLLGGRLGGVSTIVANQIAERTALDTRVMILGHLQRGGQPTPRDRYLATQFGNHAVHLAAEQRWGHMVALHGNDVTSVPIVEAIHSLKTVDPQGDMVRMARDLGITFGATTPG